MHARVVARERDRQRLAAGIDRRAGPRRARRRRGRPRRYRPPRLRTRRSRHRSRPLSSHRPDGQLAAARARPRQRDPVDRVRAAASGRARPAGSAMSSRASRRTRRPRRPRTAVACPSGSPRRRSRIAFSTVAPAITGSATWRERRFASSRVNAAAARRRASRRCARRRVRARTPGRARATARRRAGLRRSAALLRGAVGQRHHQRAGEQPGGDRPGVPEAALDRALERVADHRRAARTRARSGHQAPARPRSASRTSWRSVISSAAAVPACSATSNALRSSGRARRSPSRAATARARRAPRRRSAAARPGRAGRRAAMAWRSGRRYSADHIGRRLGPADARRVRLEDQVRDRGSTTTATPT